MFIDDVGAGPAVLVLHGAPTTVAYFRPLVEALVPTRRVLVPQFPGYGKSAAVEGQYRLESVQASLEDSLLALGVSDVAIVGYSLGAYRALALALSGRLRVNRLVLLGGFAGLAPPHAQALLAVAKTLRAMRDFSDPAFRGATARSMLAPAHATPGTLAAVESWLDATTPLALAAELEGACLGSDLHSRLGELRLPAVLRTGELDAAAPMAYSEALAAGIAGAVLQRVAGCGHALLLEDERATIDAVRAALAVPS